MRQILILIFVLAFFYGCKKSCTDGFILPVFINYPIEDIDTFIIREFRPDDNFNHLIDTVLITNALGAHSALYVFSGDTTTAYINYFSPGKYYLRPYSDWKIYVPATNQTISISNIISPQTEQAGRACSNRMTSFVQDGKLISAEFAAELHVPLPPGYPGGFAMFISK